MPPALIETQLDALLLRDARGHLTTTRGPGADPAPRLFLGRAADAHAWAIRADVGDSLRSELEALLAVEPRLAEPAEARPPVSRDRARALLAPLSHEHRGPAYVLPDTLPGDPRARLVGPEERDVWRDPFPWLEGIFEAVWPVAIAFDDDRPAAICHSPRGVTPAAAEAGVETLEPHRGRGLATAATALWAHTIQQTGRLALYSTTWDNRASQAVARRLSGHLYGEDWHLT